MSSTEDTSAGIAPVPDDVTGWIGETRYAETADFPV